MSAALYFPDFDFSPIDILGWDLMLSIVLSFSSCAFTFLLSAQCLTISTSVLGDFLAVLQQTISVCVACKVGHEPNLQKPLFLPNLQKPLFLK